MKSGWMRRIRSAAAMLALAAGVWAQGAGAAEVKNVTAEYVWPWGVEIRYDVMGTLDATAPLVVTATDKAGNVTYQAEASALSGDTGSNTGAHRLMWDLDKQGIKIQSTNVVFTVIYDPLYIVVDLAGGANASSYPVTGMELLPSGGFNTDAYKTTKLVLRKISAGSYTKGAPSGESQHKVTLGKSFYIGLFEVTQKQYQLVTGSNPSNWKSDKRPVEKVSYNAIRGSSLGANWPTNNAVDGSSFLGKLRAKTGLVFDLPTEAQWEYACRAGTTTTYSYGDSANGDYMWYISNSSSQTHEVGTKKANPWGLYDMHGNVSEWCLDWYTSSTRVIRGGDYGDSAELCSSADLRHGSPSNAREFNGFRLARPLSE